MPQLSALLPRIIISSFSECSFVDTARQHLSEDAITRPLGWWCACWRRIHIFATSNVCTLWLLQLDTSLLATEVALIATVTRLLVGVIALVRRRRVRRGSGIISIVWLSSGSTSILSRPMSWRWRSSGPSSPAIGVQTLPTATACGDASESRSVSSDQCQR